MASISGGDKLAAALKTMAGNLDKAASVDVGFPAGSTEEDGTSTPLVAAIQEFGAPSRGIPPRPFFRTMIKAHSAEWPDVAATALKATGYDAYKTLDVLGDHVAGELRQSIVDMTSTPLSPVTVMLRGMRSQKRYDGWPFGKLIAEARARVKAGKTNYGASTKPLEDTGAMLSNIVHIVK